MWRGRGRAKATSLSGGRRRAQRGRHRYIALAASADALDQDQPKYSPSSKGSSSCAERAGHSLLSDMRPLLDPLDSSAAEVALLCGGGRRPRGGA